MLSLPASVLEGAGTLTNAGSLTFPVRVASNVNFTLLSSNPASLTVPTSVTVLAGQTGAVFNVTVGDNRIVDGDRLVTVTATAAGLPVLTNTVKVLDNDPDHIRFGAVPLVTDTNTGFGITIRAENADGSLQTNFNQSLSFVADGLDGPLPLVPTNSGSFLSGQKYVTYQVTAPGRGVRLRCLEYPGQSAAFTVVPPVFRALAQPVADIAWLPAAQLLLASVPATGGIYSNCLVAIDPVTGLVTNSYPVGLDPSQIEVSPGGSYLYVAISKRTVLRRFDLGSRVAGISFPLGTNSNPVRFAYDFCVPPGLSDAVVVEARDRDSIGNISRAGIFRYSSGVPTLLGNFYSSGGWLLESLDTGYDIAVSPPLARGNASTGVISATAANFLGTTVAYRAGQFFDDHGNFYASGNLALLGTYPNVLDQSYYSALPEVDAAIRRVYYLAGYFNYGTSFYKLKVYDRDLHQPLFQLSVPSAAGSPTRFLRCGSNLLAYVTGNGQLWLIRPDATQPPWPAADLALSLSGLPPVATLGSKYTFTLTLSNAGPGVASVAQVTNALPANAAFVSAVPSTGTVSAVASALTWNVSDLAAGSNATLQVTVQFNNAGWQTNTTWALGFEADPVFTNNIATLPLDVQLPPAATGVFSLNCSSEDLLYDPVRDRLLLSVGPTALGGQSNGVAVLNPYNGLTESFTALGKQPSKLARSDDGQYLYVSLPADALVRRFDLPSLTQNLEFALGGETINGTWYPSYASDMAVVPGAPESLVAWRVRRAGDMAMEYGRGIAVFDNGIMRSNVTDTGGYWRLAFDTDSGTLFGYNTYPSPFYSGCDLRRCSLDTNGVAFAEQYPTFYSAGTNIACAGGHLFTAAGRMLDCQPLEMSWLFPGAESATLVEPDAASGRVFYLVQSSGWQIKAYDVASPRLLGSVSVPGVTGTPTSLVRWGTNGLAFRTTRNQVFIVRSPLVQPGAEADLGVVIEGPDTPPEVGKDALVILTLTNRGPLTATDVVLTNTASPNATIDWSFCTDGSIVATNGQAVWTLPALAVGQDSFAAVVIRSAQTGVVSVAASVIAVTSDVQPADNCAFLALPVGAGFSEDRPFVLQLPVNDLAWSASAGKLLLTATSSVSAWAGSLLSLDPATLAVRPELFLGADAGRLMVSRDGGMLYAGVDFGAAALTLPSLTVTGRFLLTSESSLPVVYDLAPVPGSNQSVVIASRSRTSNSTWLGAYDNGQVRANTQNFYTPGLSLQFGDDPALFYYEDFGGNGFRRYTLNAQGITLLEAVSGLLPILQPITLTWADGPLYSSWGVVIDPVTRQSVRAIPGVTNNAPLCYDPATKRVFYLMPVGVNAILQAVDAPTTVPLASRLVSGFSGTPLSVIRWGADGLAFRTSAGQVALLHSSLVPSALATDLQLSLSASNSLAFVSSNFVYSLTVTNAGANMAANAQIVLRVSSNAGVAAASASQGTAVVGPQQAVLNLGTLSPGSTAQAAVTVVAAQPGTMVAVASTTSDALDSNYSDNTCSLTNSAVVFVARDSVIVLKQSAADLAYNPANGRLYASGSAASVAVINPAYAQVETNWAVPTQPGRLAVSDDGQALYVSHDSGRQVARLETSGGQILTNFSLGTNTSGSAFRLVDMEVLPGAAGSVVVNEQAGARYLAVIDDGVTRPNRPLLPYPSNGNYLEFGNDPSVVYVSGLMPILISTNGATVVGGNNLFSTSANFKYGGGFFYVDTGDQVDPTNRISATRFTGLGTGTLVVPESPRRRVYYLTKISNVWRLRAYDPVTTDLVGSLAIPNIAGTPSALLRWGDDGLAFCTTSNQVFLLRPSLVPAGPDADLQVTQTTTPPGPVSVGTNVTFVVQVTNAGPASASTALLLNYLPTNAILVQAQSSQGTTSLSNGLLTCVLGTLTNGGTAQLTLTLRPQRGGALVNRATATSANTDPDLSNNTVTTSVGVQLSLVPDVAAVVDLQTSDMDYDPTSGLIYASLTNYLGAPYEDSIVPIDPATGLLLSPIRVAPNLSKLALSEDGSRLYVLANRETEFRRVTLPAGTTDLRVVTNVTQIKVVPGQPDSVAVVPRPYGVVIFDDAVPRPASLGWYDHIEFFASDKLIGFWNTMVPTWTARLVLTTNGVRTDSANMTYLVDGTMKADGGLIYTSGGSVFDPMALTQIRSFGVTGPVAPDHTVDRVCFLTGSGSTRVLRVFDTHALRDCGSTTITNVQGTADKLVRCGADRLAFRTSGGQIFILRSSHIPTGPPADLALGILNPAPAPTVGQTFSLTLTVTNLGPSAATAVIVSNVLPASMTLVASAPSSGFVTGDSPRVIWQVGALAAGAVATNQLVLLPRQGGAFAAQSLVWADDITDANADNDSAGTTWLVHNSPSTTALSTLALAAGDLIWEANSQRLLLTVDSPSPVASNTVLRLDPVSGHFDPPIPVGAQPGRLAIADDGQTLYVGQDASNTLAKLQWPAGTVLANYRVGRVLQIELPPAYPQLFVLLEAGNMDAYLDGAELPLYQNPSWPGIAVITRPNNAGRFYGYIGSSDTAYFTPIFYRMTVNTNSWTINDANTGVLSGPDTTIEFANGLIFASCGTVLQPETLTIVTNIPDLSSSSLVRPDVTSRLLTFLTPKSGQWWLRQYSHTNYSLLREFRVPFLSGTPKSLVRWGPDGLAFLTTSNQVYLLRPPLAFADVAVNHTAWPTQAVAGQPFQLTLCVTNCGPSFAADTYVTNTPPAGAKILQATSSQGTVTITNNQAVFALGNIATNTAISLSITVMPTNTSLVVMTNTAAVSSAFTDSRLQDNVSSVTLLAHADNDRDGMPDDWELAHGLNPNDPSDALIDSDGDGTSNLQEYLAGTDPFVFDALRILSAHIRSNAVCELTVRAAVGMTYQIETSTNLLEWAPLCTFLCQGTNYAVPTVFDPAVPVRFFRLCTTTNPPVPILSLAGFPKSSNLLLLQVAGPPGYHYSILASTNLANWSEITNFNAAIWRTVVPDPVSQTANGRFYRAMIR